MKAFVLSILSSLVFLSLIGLLFGSDKREVERMYIYSPPVAADCPKFTPPPPPPPFDPNDKFRYFDAKLPTASDFFKNRSYGQYKYSWGQTIDLKLTNGEFEYDFGPEGARGWFFLKDLLYTDVTGDGIAEALVWLVHVECGASCDGGRSMFYLFTARNEKWHEIWKYETGSYGYGCGLKSLTVLNKQLVLQMFGRCAQPDLETGSEKFVSTHTTITQFRYNGSRFVQREMEILPSPAREVKNFDAEIHIVE